jgi:hypothetical protein
MKAALAIIFFACIAGSMANPATSSLQQLIQQGQGILQTIVGQLQQTLMGVAQQALGQLSSLVASIGGRFDLGGIMSIVQSLISGNLSGLLSQLAGGITTLIGSAGRASFDIGAIFTQFLDSILPAVTGLGEHFLNQGLAAVLGGLGSLTGSRAFADIFASISEQFGQAITAAQGALTGALAGLTTLGSSILDASKPHWEQLQEQLVGHGLNVLGSLSETINNLHGSITGGR